VGVGGGRVLRIEYNDFSTFCLNKMKKLRQKLGPHLEYNTYFLGAYLVAFLDSFAINLSVFIFKFDKNGIKVYLFS
jgi:hypothetical protein